MKPITSLLLIALFFLPATIFAETLTAKGRITLKQGETIPIVEAPVFQIALGGAVIKKVRNSSSIGFRIEAEGGILLYLNRGENAKGIRLGPGRYRVIPTLDPDHRSDRITLELEPQETGEWVTEGGRQNIQKFRK